MKSSPQALYSLALFSFIALAACFGLPAGAQTTATPTPQSHKPIVEQGVEGGLWHLEKNFESRLIVTNVLVDMPMTVTPFLYMADGTEY